MAFLDPSKPIATCVSPDCTDCPVAERVHCHFRPRDLIRFLLISLPAFFTAGAGILAFGALPLVIWILLCFGSFGFVEIRVMCSHCPHYAESGFTLVCWANHGSPKLWKYRPDPMSPGELSVFFSGLCLVWGFPLPFLILGGQWTFLALFGF